MWGGGGSTWFTASSLKAGLLLLTALQMLPDLTSVYEMVNDTVTALDILPRDEADALLSQLTNQLSPSNITEAIQQV